MLTRIALLLLVAATFCFEGCSAGNTDSGPTAAGSGAPAPNSGAAGSAPSSPTPGSQR